MMVINVDDGAIPLPGHSGFGGLVRDHCGSFLLGFFGIGS